MDVVGSIWNGLSEHAAVLLLNSKGGTDGTNRLLGGFNCADHLYGGHAYVLAVHSYRQDIWQR